MNALYDRIGTKYDTTRRADPRILSTIDDLLSIASANRYVDVACGSGNYTVELAGLGGEWFAFDQSAKMLAEARAKSVAVSWSQCDVQVTHYEDSYFDGATCTLAIHHFSDLGSAFREIARILKPGGRFVIFTSTPSQMKTYWLNHYFPEMLIRSCEQMPSLEKVESALHDSGFSIQLTQPFLVSAELQDFFLYSGKQRPEMYLSGSVRNGISSFHNYCSPAELETGLHNLQADINSGEIQGVLEKHKNESGDYLFISACAH